MEDTKIRDTTNLIKNEYQKKYYHNNKLRFKKYFQKKIYCECCQCDVLKLHLKRHQQTKKHLNNKRIKELEKKLNI
jgi:hypothetical protein